MATSDPRAIPSQAFGRYNRVIDYNEPPSRGILNLPHDEDVSFGWGPPFVSITGETPPEFPGTPGGFPANMLWRRGDPDIPPPVNIARGQLNRAFVSDNIIDWRGRESTPRAGDQRMLWFHGPISRYFPMLFPAPFQTTRQDQTHTTYRNFFYDSNGNTQIAGPGDKIRGVAVRNVGDSDEEYIAITGNITDPLGMEIRAKSTDAAETSWRLLGTLGPFAQLGTDNDSPGSLINFIWEVPWHFNRLGDRCVSIVMGRNDAPDPIDRGRLFSIDFTMAGDTVFPSGLVNVTGGLGGFSRAFNSSSGSSESTEADALPDCPDAGTFTRTSETTTNVGGESERQYGETTVALDWKVDSDSGVASLKFSQIENTSNLTFGSSSESVMASACADGDDVVLLSPLNGNGSASITRAAGTADRRMSYTMDGGRHGFTKDFVFGDTTLATATINTTTTITDDVGTSTSFQTASAASDANEHIDDQNVFFSPLHEFIACDCRYGSMMFRQGFRQPDVLQFNSAEGQAPGQGGPDVFTGPRRNFRVGGFVGEILIGAIFDPFGPPGPPRPFFSWYQFHRWKTRLHIETENTSVQFDDVDEPYAAGFLITGGGIRKHLLEVEGVGVAVPFEPPEGTDETIDISNSTAIPTNLRVQQYVPAQSFDGQPERHAVHDRHGEYFYVKQVISNEGLVMRNLFAGVNNSPSFTRTSHADYEFDDPIAAVAIPGDVPLFTPMFSV